MDDSKEVGIPSELANECLGYPKRVEVLVQQLDIDDGVKREILYYIHELIHDNNELSDMNWLLHNEVENQRKAISRLACTMTNVQDEAERMEQRLDRTTQKYYELEHEMRKKGV